MNEATHSCPMCGYRPGVVVGDEAKLPQRYRRAYRFLLANLTEPDLTVLDLAQAAGVTERAIQSTWRKYMGCPPATTIRGLRAEKIRYEIVTTDKSIMDCAAKFGVYNRGTLIKLFHGVFGCTPSALRAPSTNGSVAPEAA